MVPLAPAPLSDVGFRRDIRLFLGALVGFLVFIVIVLVVQLQSFLLQVESTEAARREAVATAATDLLEAEAEGDAESLLTFLRGHFSLLALELATPGGRVVRSGLPMEPPLAVALQRPTERGLLTVWFDASESVAARRRFRWTAAIALTAAILSTLFLFLYLPRIIRPIEQMLVHARELGERSAEVDEAKYLIDTFRTSIDTLRRQESELKRLHEAEKARADELEAVSATLKRSLTSGFVSLDADGGIVEVNDAARQILHLPAGSDLRGRTPREAAGENGFTRWLERALAERAAHAREEVALQSGSEESVLGVSTVPLRNESGAFLGMLALFTDLTPIRHLETRLREMQALADLGEISAGIAHEFRNSLSTILGYLQLAGRHPLSPEAEAKVEEAKKETRELARTIEALLAFARPIALERQEVDVREVIEATVARLAPQRDEVAIEIGGEDLVISGDPVLLGRAFENLLRNAIESIREKGNAGRVSVSISREARSVAIEDDGAGVDPEEIARLFLPFQTGKAFGSGLGLPLAKKIALLHGGTIRMSGRKGEGASVVITFAAHQA